MELLSSLMGGFETALSGWNLLFCLIGVSIGMFVGVLPGLGPIAGISLLIPVTYGLEPVTAIILLSGIFYGAMYAGAITSILMNLPGEAASLITCLDGHPLAQQGRAGAALGVAAIGSFLGGIAALLALTFIGPSLASYALKFGPPEYFAILILGLLMIVALMGKSIIRGMIGAVSGLLIAMIGMDPVSGTPRYTFGQLELLDGIDMVAVAMGMFAISEILFNAEHKITGRKKGTITKLLPNRDEWKPVLKSIGRGTGIGMFTGLVPGIGSVTSTIMSYTVEKKLAKDPSRFGKGAIEGVAGPETANNVHSGAAFIPLFTLGIPSSPVLAVMLGAFVMHGLTPGPKLFQTDPDFVWGVIASMFIGNIILLIMNMPLVKVWASISLVPYKLLYPIILILSLVGAYSINNNLWNVGIMIIFGILGYVMRKLDISISAFILSLVLAPMIEESLLQSLAISKGTGVLIFFTRPLSGIIMGIAICILIVTVVKRFKRKKNVISEVPTDVAM